MLSEQAKETYGSSYKGVHVVIGLFKCWLSTTMKALTRPHFLVWEQDLSTQIRLNDHKYTVTDKTNRLPFRNTSWQNNKQNISPFLTIKEVGITNQSFHFPCEVKYKIFHATTSYTHTRFACAGPMCTIFPGLREGDEYHQDQHQREDETYSCHVVEVVRTIFFSVECLSKTYTHTPARYRSDYRRVESRGKSLLEGEVPGSLPGLQGHRKFRVQHY